MIKLSDKARAYINVILVEDTAISKELGLGLSWALSEAVMRDQVSSDKITSYLERRLNTVNNLVSIKMNIDTVLGDTLSLVKWRKSLSMSSYPSMPISTDNYPLAGVLGFSAFMGEPEVKAMCHPKMPMFILGWREVLAS